MQRHADDGEGHTEHGGAVLGDDGPQRGVAQRLHAAALGTHLVQGPQQGDALHDQGHGEDDQAHDVARGRLLGAVAQSLYALEDGEAGAHHEDSHGGEQRPEEPLLAVAEGVPVVGGAAAAAQGREEEDLVEAVGHGVGGLGEQRG